jgi:CRISPR-associated protein Cmr5
MSQQQSLEQKRAKAAWEAVNSVQRNQKEYLSLAKNAPADIQMSGLGQTLSFWQAKAKSEHKDLYNHVSGWVTKQLGLKHSDLMEWIMAEASSQQYRHATNEALAFLVWVKRFAQAAEGSGT